ncbi:MAG: hypothetical protein Q9207_007553 [Kuettlingeria erythrocarpa]
MAMFCVWFLVILPLLLQGSIAAPSPGSPASVADGVIQLLSRQENSNTAPGNATLPSTISAGRHQIVCSGERYRRDLQRASCLDAVRQIPLLDRDESFQTRERGPYDALLPTRFISGTSCFLTLPTPQQPASKTDLHFEADGLCIVEPVLEDAADKATASYQDISRAAYELLSKCVVRSSAGGIATDIGMTKKPSPVVIRDALHITTTI